MRKCRPLCRTLVGPHRTRRSDSSRGLRASGTHDGPLSKPASAVCQEQAGMCEFLPTHEAGSRASDTSRSPDDLRQPSTARQDRERRRLEARVQIVVSSRSGEFKADEPPQTRELECEGKSSISSGRCRVRREPQPGGLGLPPSPTASTDTRTFPTGPPASASTTRPPNSTVAVVFGQLSAVASNAADDPRTDRDEAKLSQHAPFISPAVSCACSYRCLSVHRQGGSRQRRVFPCRQRYTVGHQPAHC